MFAGCNNIIKINLNSFNSEYVTNMKYMFYKCNNLKNINLSSFITKNVTDMSGMFHECISLENLDYVDYICHKFGVVEITIRQQKEPE